MLAARGQQEAVGAGRFRAHFVHLPHKSAGFFSRSHGEVAERLKAAVC